MARKKKRKTKRVVKSNRLHQAISVKWMKSDTRELKRADRKDGYKSLFNEKKKMNFHLYTRIALL